MKKNKIQKSETPNLKLVTKKAMIPKAQLKGIKGGIVEVDAEGF